VAVVHEDSHEIRRAGVKEASLLRQQPFAVRGFGMCLRVFFVEGRLAKASSYSDYEDVGGKKKTLFVLEATGRTESQ
jgi:hypothetical protein